MAAVQANDTKRGLLYTSLWDGGVENDQDNTYAEVHKVWLLQRFIAAPAK